MAKRVRKAANVSVGRGKGQPSHDLSSPYGQTQITVTYGGNFGIVRGGPADWFGPLDPMAPIAPPAVAGRAWDFPAGYNLISRPRAYEPISFQDLRNLAETCDVMRLVIETRKDQLERIPWSIKPKGEHPEVDPETDSRIPLLRAFFENPDGEHGWGRWLRMLLEDLFVLDAPALYKERSRGGQVIALHVLDGSTIKRVIDDWGRTPMPYVDDAGVEVVPPAYQQQLKGFPAVNYAADEICYQPRNVRPHKVYGYSPVEQVIMTVNITLRRQISTLQYYTEGNIPEALIGVPDQWTPEQIVSFQRAWDEMMEGNTAQKRHAKFVPGGVAKGYTPTREPELKSPHDEWLARVVCFAFSIPPTPFVMQVNRATAQSAAEVAQEEGLEPILLWVKGLIDSIIRDDFGIDDLEFSFADDVEVDPTKQAEVHDKRLAGGVMTLDEIRDELGLPAYGIAGVTDKPMVKTASGYKLIDAEGVKNQPPPDLSSAAGGDGGGAGGGGPGGPDDPARGAPPPPSGKAKGGDGQAASKAAGGRKVLNPLDPNRPALAHARKTLTEKVNAILTATAKEVAAQLPAAIARDEAARHPE